MRLFCKEKTYIKAFKMKYKLLFFVIILILSFSFIMYYISFRLKPSLELIADSTINSKYSQIVNKSVLDVLNEENVTYNDLIYIGKNDNGDINIINNNIVLINRLKSDLALKIIKEADKISAISIDVPLIQLFESSLFQMPKINIPVEIYSLNTLFLDFKTTFEEAGINQTNVKISLIAKIEYTLLTPMSKVDSKLECEVLIGNSVIVGIVPDSYVNVTSDPSTLKDDILQLAPNE